LQEACPQELVPLKHGEYCLRSHDSLKISNGKWHWFSRGIGGRSALDYLIKVEGIPFMDAVLIDARNFVAGSLPLNPDFATSKKL